MISLFVSELAKTKQYESQLKDALDIFKNQLDYGEKVITGIDFSTSDYNICTYTEYSKWILNCRSRLIIREFHGRKWYILFESTQEFESAMNNIKPVKPYTWTRLYDTSSGEVYGYEVSSKGDKRFSPFVMRLQDGRTLEEYYQLDVKGYRQSNCTDMLQVKGLPPKSEIEFSWFDCYTEYFKRYPGLLYELAVAGLYQPFTDMFDPDGGQNKVFCMILNKMYNLK